MKKILFILCLFISVTVFNSCSKDDDGIDPKEPNTEKPDPNKPTVTENTILQGGELVEITPSFSSEYMSQGFRVLQLNDKKTGNAVMVIQFMNWKDIYQMYSVGKGENLIGRLQKSCGVFDIRKQNGNVITGLTPLNSMVQITDKKQDPVTKVTVITLSVKLLGERTDPKDEYSLKDCQFESIIKFTF